MTKNREYSKFTKTILLLRSTTDDDKVVERKFTIAKER